MKVPKKKARHFRQIALLRGFAGMFATAAGFFVAICLVSLILPKSLNPFYPLHPDDDIGPLTKWKMQALALSPDACRGFLNAAGVTFTEIPDRSEKEFCHVRNAVRMTSGGPPLYPNSPTMACPVAAGLVLWYHQGLQPAAQAMMQSPITRIDHLGSYSCRRQYGRDTGWVSEHAYANAVDIQGFQFANGQAINLLDDWNPKGGQSTGPANFLRMAQDRGCDVFKVVLGPQANAAHKNHFHLDMGPLASCR